MSLQLSVKAPSRSTAIASSDEPRGTSRGFRARNEPVETPAASGPPFGVACRDVLDEVRQRMAVRGFHWE